jgi:hypothetical protein
MVRAWYTVVQSDEEEEKPTRFLNLEELFNLTGVEYFQVEFNKTVFKSFKT